MVRGSSAGALLLMGAAILGGCSGGETNKAAPTAGASGAAPAASAPAAAPAGGSAAATPATGKTWEVKELGDAKGYRFEPKALTIAAGDAVKWIMVSGGPHDVTFWADSIPAGAAAQLQANMPNTLGPLMAPLQAEANAAYTVSFGGATPGTYHYYCTPHLAMGMVATITVKPGK